MSRLRILNLPNSVDEQQLKDHITPHLPRGSREVTDVTIIRNAKNGAVRMAFVGFNNATIGKHIIEKLDGSYFGALSIKVSEALGLREAREEKEQEEKKKAQIAEKRKAEKDAALGIENGGDNVVDGSGGGQEASQGGKLVPRRRQRGDEDSDNDDNQNDANGKNGSNPQKKKNGLIDVNEQLLEQAQKNGPSWGTELLLPPEQQQQKNKNNNKKGDKLQQDAAAAGAATSNQQQQQQLDLSSDEAFLRSITTKATASASTTKEQDIEEKRKQEALSNTNRVHVTNLPYIATAKDLKNFFSSKCGNVTECHIPVTKDTKQSKGIGYLRFASHGLAKKAVDFCDGAVFMGRVIRVDLSEEDPYAHLRYSARVGEDGAVAGGASSSGDTSFKDIKDARRKKADDLGLSWNTTYVGNAAAIQMTANKLGIDSTDIVNSSRQGAAVRAAVAEAHITSEARKTLGSEGINFELLNGDRALHTSRSDTTILVKHIHPGTSINELTSLFAKNGTIETVAAPQDVSIALIRFANSDNASVAFQKLAYKKMKGTPLFLEWAPIGTMKDDILEEDKYKNTDEAFMAKFNNNNNGKGASNNNTNDLDDDLNNANRNVFTLYVTNLPFGVSESSFRDFIADAVSKIASHPELITKISLQANKGRAYVTVADQATESLILSKLDGKSFQGRSLSVQISKSTVTAPDSSAIKTDSVAEALIRENHQQNNNSENNINNNASASAAAQKASNNNYNSGDANGGSASSGAALCPPGRDPLKLIVKNLPFEATEEDLRQLFSAFTEIKSVRVPKRVQKFNQHHKNNHRGFGFVEFLTAEEAVKAKVALGSTHLYGRHLVLDFADKGAMIE